MSNKPCLCGSGKLFRDCCGGGEDRYVSDVVQVNKVETHHYFIMDGNDFTKIVRDKDNNAMIWKSRDKALAWGNKNLGKLCPNPFAVVGMGDEKWLWFQSEEKFVIVE